MPMSDNLIQAFEKAQSKLYRYGIIQLGAHRIKKEGSNQNKRWIWKTKSTEYTSATELEVEQFLEQKRGVARLWQSMKWRFSSSFRKKVNLYHYVRLVENLESLDKSPEAFNIQQAMVFLESDDKFISSKTIAQLKKELKDLLRQLEISTKESLENESGLGSFKVLSHFFDKAIDRFEKITSQNKFVLPYISNIEKGNEKRIFSFENLPLFFSNENGQQWKKVKKSVEKYCSQSAFRRWLTRVFSDRGIEDKVSFFALREGYQQLAKVSQNLSLKKIGENSFQLKQKRNPYLPYASKNVKEFLTETNLQLIQREKMLEVLKERMDKNHKDVSSKIKKGINDIAASLLNGFSACKEKIEEVEKNIYDSFPMQGSLMPQDETTSTQDRCERDGLVMSHILRLKVLYNYFREFIEALTQEENAIKTIFSLYSKEMAKFEQIALKKEDFVGFYHAKKELTECVKKGKIYQAIENLEKRLKKNINKSSLASKNENLSLSKSHDSVSNMRFEWKEALVSAINEKTDEVSGLFLRPNLVEEKCIFPAKDSEFMGFYISPQIFMFPEAKHAITKKLVDCHKESIQFAYICIQAREALLRWIAKEATPVKELPLKQLVSTLRKKVDENPEFKLMERTIKKEYSRLAKKYRPTDPQRLTQEIKKMLESFPYFEESLEKALDKWFGLFQEPIMKFHEVYHEWKKMIEKEYPKNNDFTTSSYQEEGLFEPSDKETKLTGYIKACFEQADKKASLEKFFEHFSLSPLMKKDKEPSVKIKQSSKAVNVVALRKPSLTKKSLPFYDVTAWKKMVNDISKLLYKMIFHTSKLSLAEIRVKEATREREEVERRIEIITKRTNEIIKQKEEERRQKEEERRQKEEERRQKEEERRQKEEERRQKEEERRQKEEERRQKEEERRLKEEALKQKEEANQRALQFKEKLAKSQIREVKRKRKKLFSTGEDEKTIQESTLLKARKEISESEDKGILLYLVLLTKLDPSFNDYRLLLLVWKENFAALFKEQLSKKISEGSLSSSLTSLWSRLEEKNEIKKADILEATVAEEEGGAKEILRKMLAL